MSAVNKQDLVYAVSLRAELAPETARRAVDAVLDTIEGSLCAGRQVAIKGFGRFEIRERRGRTGRNPRTGALVTVPPRQAVAFVASARLKQAVQVASGVGGVVPDDARAPESVA